MKPPTESRLSIAGRMLSRSSDPFVIAEAGVNHNGSVTAAHQLVDAAAAAGANAVKFQTFEPAQLVKAGTSAAEYQQRQTGLTDQKKMLDDLALPPTAWSELMAHAADLDIMFLSTPFDLASLGVLVDLGVPAIKASSADLTNHLLLSALRETGLPLLISTGGSYLREVQEAVDVLGGTDNIVLFHCVMSYPAPLETSNLRAIATLRDEFDCPVGWSDHTIGNTSAIAATALGANVFEKHLTLDRSLPGPDHRASADPVGFASYIEAINAAWSSIGSGEKVPHACEEETRQLVRRGLYAARSIPAGAILTTSDIVALRPMARIDATNDLVGHRTTRPIGMHEPLDWSDLA